MIPGINGSVLASAYKASKLKRRYADGGPIKPSAKLNSVDPQGQASYQAGLQSGPVNLGLRGAANIPQFKNTYLQPSLEYKAKSLSTYLNPQNVGGSYQGKSTYLNADYNIPTQQTNLAAGYNSDKLSLNANANLEKNKLMGAGVDASYNVTPNLSVFGDLRWDKQEGQAPTSYNVGFSYKKQFKDGGTNDPPKRKMTYDTTSKTSNTRSSIYQDAENIVNQETQTIQSPEYAALLQKEFYGDNTPNQATKERINARVENLNNLKVDVPFMSFLDFGKDELAKYDPTRHQIKVKKDRYDPGIFRHELSHSSDSSYTKGADEVGPYFSNVVTEDLKNAKSEYSDETTKYMRDPSEIKARLKALRDASIEQGYKLMEPGYDINKYKEQLTPSEKMQYDQLKKSGVTDEQINKYMYLFAKNQTNTSKTAKVGARIDNDDKEMVEGVASILRDVKSKKNRLQLANKLAKQFNRENVDYNLSDFLNKSKVKK